MKTINSFSGEYRWLSNFYPVNIMVYGITFHTVEAAFQASKTLDLVAREHFKNLLPSDAKRAGRKLRLRPDWEEVKEEIMLDLLRRKFRDKSLGEKLLATGDTLLVEGNDWGDTYWGVCRGRGMNRLGCLLMQVRGELKRSLV